MLHLGEEVAHLLGVDAVAAADFHETIDMVAFAAAQDLTPAEAIQIWRGRNAAGVRTVVAVEPVLEEASVREPDHVTSSVSPS